MPPELNLKRLAIVLTHPVQYYSPLFQLLVKRGIIQVKVFYTWERGAERFDQGFQKQVQWDIPLLEGYEYDFISNGGNPNRGFWSLKNKGLIRAIEEWGANAVLLFGWNYYSHLKTMRYFKGKIPVLFRGDSTLLDEKKNVQALFRRILLKWVYRHVDIALYVGSNNKAYFLIHGLKERQLVFAPHAIDNERFADSSYDERAKELRRELSIPEDKIVFIYIGKIEEKKDPLLLISAFKELRDDNIYLIVVGNGELETEAKELAAHIPNIQFLGFQNQSIIPAIYRCGDVFVLPSKGPGETWGLAVNEALACSRAVLVSDKVGCAVDLVRNGQNGYIFRHASLPDLKKCIELFLDGSLLKKMQLESGLIIRGWSYENQAIAIENAVNN